MVATRNITDLTELIPSSRRHHADRRSAERDQY